MNEDQLNAMLRRLGVTGTPLKESLQLAKSEDFQIACHKSFNGPSTSLLHTRDFVAQRAFALLKRGGCFCVRAVQRGGG